MKCMQHLDQNRSIESKQFDIELFNISRFRTEIYGFAILWIMVFHSKAVYPAFLRFFFSKGNMGCEIFLFISGISLFFAFQKKPTLSSYLERRLMRLLIPVFLISSWEWLILYFTGKNRLLILISQFTLTRLWITGDQQNWFLSCILISYLLYPFLYSFFYERKGKMLFKATFAYLSTALFILMIYFLVPNYYGKVEVALTRIPVFVLGAASGNAVYERQTIRKKAPVIFIVLLLFVFFSFILLSLHLLSPIQIRLFYMIPGISLVIILSVVFEKFQDTAVNRFFSFLGQMTIELYIIHLLGRRLLPFTGFYNEKSHLHYFIMLACSVGLAYGFHKLNNLLSARIEKALL